MNDRMKEPETNGYEPDNCEGAGAIIWLAIAVLALLMYGVYKVIACCYE